MKRPVLITFMAISLSLIGSAQRVSTHSGFSGHAGASFRGGITSRPARFGAAPSRGFSRSASQGRFQRPQPQRQFGYRPPYVGSAHRRRQPYRPPWRLRHPYVSLYAEPLVNGWMSPYLPDYLDYQGNDSDTSGDQGNSQSASTAAADQGPYAEGYADPLPPWPSGSRPASNAVPAAPAAAEGAVTLIFRDGRASEQIHNYLVTPTTLAVLDQQRRDIPLDQIDLVATVRANRDAGVDFSVPGVPPAPQRP